MASATNTFQPSMTKMLVIFVVSSIGLLLINDLVFYNLFKGSIVQDQSQFVKKNELNEFRSMLNFTVDQRAEIAISKERGRIGELVHDATGKLRDLIYQEKSELSKQIEAKVVEIKDEIASEKSKLKEEMNSEHSKLKTELESIKKELNEKVAKLGKDLEDIQWTSEVVDQSIDELRKQVKQVDVNKEETEFVFEIKEAKAFLNADSLSETKLSEFFQCRGISWYLVVKRTTKPETLKKELYITLFPHNQSDNHDWKIKTDIKIGILEQYGRANITNEAEYTYRKEKPNDGYSIFVDIDELHEDEFIKDDSILVFVNLKADKLIRSSLV